MDIFFKKTKNHEIGRYFVELVLIQMDRFVVSEFQRLVVKERKEVFLSENKM